MPPASTTPPRWQDDGLSISFRSCQLQGLLSLHDALAHAQNGDQPVLPSDVKHLDVAENEVEQTAGEVMIQGISVAMRAPEARRQRRSVRQTTGLRWYVGTIRVAAPGFRIVVLQHVSPNVILRMGAIF